MNILKLAVVVVIFGALVALLQLADTPLNSPALLYQRLPDVQRSARAAKAPANSFESLAGGTVAEIVLSGNFHPPTTRPQEDSLEPMLDNVRPMVTVFPPAENGLALTRAAAQAGAINASLRRQFRTLLAQMQTDARGALAVEKFKDNFMPVFELAKHCRTWDEFQAILLQADSPDQLKVLTKMASGSSGAAQKLSAILATAATEGRATVTTCIDFIMRQGPKGLDALDAALDKGAAGLLFVSNHPGFAPSSSAKPSVIQATYHSLRYQYGGAVAALKYFGITLLTATLVLVVVPGRYLEKLVARPGVAITPGAFHYFLSALAVGLVFSGLAYLLSLAVRPVAPPAAALAAGVDEAAAGAAADNPLLSGSVVLLSLAVHAVVWFIVRGKLRQVEDDETSPVDLRLKRLENLDVFLDLPLFTGLALTVCAFILITINAGMSRHFAYSATVVGILSAVSLRIRYLYPLKERLIQSR